jgi:hypothetical protein
VNKIHQLIVKRRRIAVFSVFIPTENEIRYALKRDSYSFVLHGIQIADKKNTVKYAQGQKKILGEIEEPAKSADQQKSD